MNIDKFLKSIPPIANKAKQFFETMDPLPQVLTALGVILILMGAILYGPVLLFAGGILVGLAIGHRLFEDMSLEEMNAFLKKVFIGVPDFIADLGVVAGIMILGSITFLVTGLITMEFGLIMIGILGMVGALAMMGKFPGLKTYIVSLDIPTKLKNVGTKVGGFKFPSSFTAFGDRTPFGLLFPLAVVSAVGLIFFSVYNATIGTNSASAAMYQIGQCVEEKDSDLLKDKYILKAICGTKQQKELPNETLTGGADFDLAGDDVMFSGHVKLTSVHIVTEFTVIVKYEGKTDSKIFHNVWIEPNNKHEFRFKPSEIKNKPSEEDVNTTDFTWSIREIKGVPIVE